MIEVFRPEWRRKLRLAGGVGLVLVLGFCSFSVVTERLQPQAPPDPRTDDPVVQLAYRTLDRCAADYNEGYTDCTIFPPFQVLSPLGRVMGYRAALDEQLDGRQISLIVYSSSRTGDLPDLSNLNGVTVARNQMGSFNFQRNLNGVWTIAVDQPGSGTISFDPSDPDYGAQMKDATNLATQALAVVNTSPAHGIVTNTPIPRPGPE